MALTDIEFTPTPEQRAALLSVLERERPGLVDRLDAARFSRSSQDFFPHTEIVRIDFTSPHPGLTAYLALPTTGPGSILSKSLDALHAVARADPPTGLETEARAEVYADAANRWTSETVYGEFELASFDELPLYRRLNDDMKAEVAALRAQLATRIIPRMRRQANGVWHIRYWLVDSARLIERQLTVPPDGLLRRLDVAQPGKLPAYIGKIWGLVEGRLTPIG